MLRCSWLWSWSDIWDIFLSKDQIWTIHITYSLSKLTVSQNILILFFIQIYPPFSRGLGPLGKFKEKNGCFAQSYRKTYQPKLTRVHHIIPRNLGTLSESIQTGDYFNQYILGNSTGCQRCILHLMTLAFHNEPCFYNTRCSNEYKFQWKIVSGSLKNHWTKHSLLCTHFIYFCANSKHICPKK